MYVVNYDTRLRCVESGAAEDKSRDAELGRKKLPARDGLRSDCLGGMVAK